MNLIVFDIDDTLTKSENQHEIAFVNTMHEFGITEINKNWGQYQHYTDSHILKQNYEANFNNTFELDFITDFEIRMHEIILSLPKVTEIKGSKKIIEDFNNNPNYAISFATGSLLKPAIVKLNQAEITYKEQLVVGSNSIYDREGIVKEAIQRAKDFYQINTFDHIISVGDGIWDMKTAQNLNLHFIGIGMKNYLTFKNKNIKFYLSDWSNFQVADLEENLFL